MNAIKQLTNSVVDSYINDQWINYRRALIPPQAREELLAGAKIYFYLSSTTVPATVFSDDRHEIAASNPIMAGSGGIFQDVYLDGLVKIEIMDRNNTILLTTEL